MPESTTNKQKPQPIFKYGSALEATVERLRFQLKQTDRTLRLKMREQARDEQRISDLSREIEKLRRENARLRSLVGEPD